MPNENEQWLLSGNCSKCRREKYCSKPCTRCKRTTKAMVQGMISSELNKITGGAYERIMENSKY